MNKTATITDVMSWDPCEKYSLECIVELFAGREALSAAEILDLNIPLTDCFWGVLREHFFVESDLHLMGAAFAESILSAFENKYPDDTRPRNAVKAARLYALGEIDKNELAAARAAARAAAWAAAGSAVRSAAEAAAWAAAWAAAGSAARAAAEAAARAALIIEKQKQLKIIKFFIEK